MISNGLQQLIKERDIKQIDLANYLGITPSRLSNYMRGKREPSYQMLSMIAKFLNVDMNYFASNSFGDGDYSTSKADWKNIVCEDGERSTTSVRVPVQVLNSKKKDIPSESIEFSRTLFKDISDMDNSLLLLICNENLANGFASKGDLLITAKIDNVKLASGDVLIENGRFFRVLTYIKNKDTMMLIDNKDSKVNIAVDSLDQISNYFKLLYLIKKY